MESVRSMENMQSSIESVTQSYIDAFYRADAAGVASCYTDDAKVLPHSAPMVTGRDAIQSMFQGVIEMGIKEIKADRLGMESDGNLAYDYGRYVLTGEQPNGEGFQVTGKYVQVWKNQDGSWKIHVDIWNEDEG